MKSDTIWIDIDNSPHVPVFRPIIQELEKRSTDYIITSRDFAQTQELLKFWNIKNIAVGKHGGKNKFKKVLNLIQRSNELKKLLNQGKKMLAVSHGSRTQLLAAWRMNIKSILMLDYEYTESRLFNYLSSLILIPKYIPDQRLKSVGINLKKVKRYNGFKEELYLRHFTFDKEFRNKINVLEDEILVVIRPPSFVGNYHDHKSEQLLLHAINYFSNIDNTVVLIVNRTLAEKKFILNGVKKNEKIRFLEKSVDGLQLLFSADISISGGGTMNREAALLGTKAYSIFTGRRPYLDDYLMSIGKLKFIETTRDFEKIQIKRDIKIPPKFENNLAGEITDIIVNF